ncbi:MAG: hypothetical protein HKP32_05450 [Woeseia sp.]|nr:SGNH/GDSL hydrolase family protein [Woeseia sp.]MBT8097769.1 SGNH/GDSL hydrolase family protein [Woeseia sp.]NNL54577.1 hypothetical protein [Woeseia sp.]
MKRLGNFIRDGLIIVVTTLALLLIIEGAVRVLYPQIQSFGNSKDLFSPARYGDSHGLTPNVSGQSIGALVVTDSNGFRIDPDAPAQDNRNTTKVLFVGDSVTMPTGVVAGDGFPYLIEDNLPNVSITNSAVVGHAFGDYLSVIRNVDDSLYDGIFVGICLNDISRRSFGPEQQAQIATQDTYAPWYFRALRKVNEVLSFNEFLRVRSRTYLLTKSLVSDRGREHFLGDKEPYEQAQTDEVLDEFFVELAKLGAEKGAPVFVAVFPYEYQLRNGQQPDVNPQERITGAANRAGLDTVDLWIEMKHMVEQQQYVSTDYYIFGDSMHLSITGNRVVADIILNNPLFKKFLSLAEQTASTD